MITNEATQHEARRPKFDGTINLGHIITATAMLLGGFTVWMQSQIVVAKQDTRLTYIEREVESSHIAMKQLIETQNLALRTQDKIVLTLEMINKQSRPN